MADNALFYYVNSDIGQNLVPATFIGDELFLIMVATTGLVLLTLLIGNMLVSSTNIC